MKIIVTGSLGNIGKPLTEILVKQGHHVVVVSSNAAKQAEIEAMGAKAAIGSIEDVDFLTATFTGADVVHAMIPPNNAVADPAANNERVGMCLVEGIKRAGVKRVVYVSSYGADLDKGTGLIVGHHWVEEALNTLPLEALTHLRATYIYYNLYTYVGMIKNAGFIVANYGGDDVTILVSPQDIAEAATDELVNQAPGNHVRYVASDERTCNEIAKVLGEAIGKPDLQWNTISNAEMQSGLEAHGLPAKVAGQMTEMFEACHTGLLHRDYDQHKPALSKVKLEDFAKEFAAAYKQN